MNKLTQRKQPPTVTLRRLKDTLSAIPIAGPALQKVYKRYRRWRYDLSRRLGIEIGRMPRVQVVQIGSNDGSTDDPVRRHLERNPDWRALLVEPVPFLFERLALRYHGDSRMQFANVAVGPSDGTCPFFYLARDTPEKIPNLPHYWHGIGSFNRSHILENFGERVADCIVEVAIPTCTFDTLLRKHGISKVDLLAIDTEGADWMILEQFPLKDFRPAIIIVEHKHLHEDERRQMIKLLESDYEIEDFGEDFFCRAR